VPLGGIALGFGLHRLRLVGRAKDLVGQRARPAGVVDRAGEEVPVLYVQRGGESRKLKSTGASDGSGTSALLRRVDLGGVDLGLGSPGR